MKNELTNNTSKYILLATGIVLIFLITVFSGRNGLYFFDVGISYNMGWLIYNGRIPYVDIIMPLAPLNGYLVALGYKLFGINFMSAVYLAAFFSSVGFTICFSVFSKYLQLSINFLVSMILTLSTFPLIGTLYYNNMTAYFITLLLAICFKRLCFKDTPISTLGMWCVIVLLGLTKFHLGALAFVLGVGIEFFSCKIYNKKYSRKYVLTYIFSPLIVGALALFSCFHFNFADFFYCLNIPKFQIYFQMPHSTLIYSSFITILIISLGLFCKYFHKAKYYGLVYYGIFSTTLLFFTSITSPDTICTYYLSLANFILYAYYLCISVLKLKNTQVLNSITLLLFFSVFISQSLYIANGSRKLWDEKQQAFISDLPMGTHQVKEGFFKGVYLRESQYNTITIIDNVVKNNPNKKIHFAAMMEMFYPAHRILPPQKWVLWSHPEVSFSTTTTSPILRVALQTADYDLILYVPQRLWASWSYMNMDELGFHYFYEPYWIGVAGKTMFNISKRNIAND